MAVGIVLIVFAFYPVVRQASEPIVAMVDRVAALKGYGDQIAMIVLAIGSLLLCFAPFTSELLPRFLSVWASRLRRAGTRGAHHGVRTEQDADR